MNADISLVTDPLTDADMDAGVQRLVAEHARLFMQFVATLHANDADLFDRHPAVAASAERTFQHLSDLLQASTRLTSSSEPVEAAVRAALVDPDAKRRIYGELIDRIRSKVSAAVTPGSVVAVVSRGDGPLLELPGVTGWHFPRNELGVWAGFHPADSQHAVELIVEARTAGAGYLLIPSTGFWWLDFYEALRSYLGTECTIIVDDDDLKLYTLPAATVVETPSIQTRVYDRQQGQFARFVSALLPAGSEVAVVSRGDVALLDLDGLRAHHFPAGVDGRYNGTPTSDHDALGALQRAIAAGVEFLAVPHAMDWWLDMFPVLHEQLVGVHRCIAQRCQAGSIFHLSAANPLKELP